jgi:DNA-binding NarL/FixJ family response regulator
MQQRDVSRNWSRNRRNLIRDRKGRILTSTRLVLTATQERTVQRLLQTGKSLEAIAEAIGVSRNTLQRRLRDQLSHLPRRGRAWMDVACRPSPTDEELRVEIERMRLE